ncbi:S-adenosyl-L-methionine-dependent methyltransferase [Aspergillus filifer]
MEGKISEAKATIAELTSLDISTPSSKQEIIQKCQSIIKSLQDPGQVVMETLASVANYPCLVALSNLGVFEKLAASKEPLTATHLATECSADKWLVTRLMRVAVAWDIIEEAGPETYTATGASRIFAMPAFAAGLRNTLFSSKILSDIPQFLKETSYANPTDYHNGLFQYNMKTKLGLFEWRAGNKEAMDDFNMFMTIQRTRGQQWCETFDIKRRIFEGVEIDPAKPLLVDIAGGFGQDLRLFKAALQKGGHAVSKGQLVLQDQAHVISNVPSDMHDPDFSYLPHDFFTPQPIKGARIYTLKGVIHDWTEVKALQILRNTASALEKGYSKLWILDGVVPDTGADKIMAGLDIGMMALFGACERTREQWGTLLRDAGLKIESVSTGKDGFGLIEAVLDD